MVRKAHEVGIVDLGKEVAGRSCRGWIRGTLIDRGQLEVHCTSSRRVDFRQMPSPFPIPHSPFPVPNGAQSLFVSLHVTGPVLGF